MYNPPLIEFFLSVYREGYEAAKNGKLEKDNPYFGSRNEYQDSSDYWWNQGYNDYCGG